MSANVVWALIAVILVLAAAALFFYVLQRERTRKLRAQFGPEYDRALEKAGRKREAEADLLRRKRRVEKIELQPLSEGSRVRFADAWASIQKRFVDAPAEAVAEANRLLKDLMTARGYPMTDFEQRAEEISVHYPSLVFNYRAAREIARRSQSRQATTEELRQAFVHYRQLFEELLGPEPARMRAAR
jgi:hypothetical protein